MLFKKIPHDGLDDCAVILELSMDASSFFLTFGHCRHVGQSRPLTTADVNRTGV
jgi:hypothetical protein